MKFELPVLPYELDELEPFISRKTLEYHYGKHHQTYISNLNNLISETKFENAKLETIIMQAEGPLLNNAAQAWNHTFYFMALNRNNKSLPHGILADAIQRGFGTFLDFKDAFTKAGVSLFGCGWVWLVKNQNGQLEIIQEINAGNPLRKGLKPILTCDVWEHAYYLDYQNRRNEYINSFWSIIDWTVIEKRFNN
ncbi:MAG TPA: Fe-Mn family superoxide dismutase [Paludibacteraceae bacterium]|nr:Fe-Mn family superoxide dismutase [Paludibacteraceae bacterium]